METSKVYQLLDGQVEKKEDSSEEDGLQIYHVQWEKKEEQEKGFRVLSIGQPCERPTKCVLLLGVTGSGKTTFISGVLNNFLGVRFEDPFRLKVKEVTGRMETESQTDFITVYTIYYKEGMRHGYNLVIIDTPGLADTRGAQQAHNIRSYLEEFITSDFGVEDLHCLGLVAKANINRDLESEKSLLREIISLLGDSVPEITQIFATFAADRPTVDAVVRNNGVQYKNMFQFDNGILYNPANRSTCSERERNYVSYRWDEMSQQYEECFEALDKASPLSLRLIRERKFLDTSKKNLIAEIKQLATSVTEMEINNKAQMKYTEQETINQNWKQMESTGLPEGLLAYNCYLCNQTCITLTNVGHFGNNTEGDALFGPLGTALGSAFGPVGSVLGGIGGAVGGKLFGRKKRRRRNNNNIQESVCRVNGCTHTLAQHKQESIKLQEKIYEDKKKLYDEAVSMLKDVKTKLINVQEEMMRSTTAISHITVKLLHHAKTIEILSEQDRVSISDISSQLQREVTLFDHNIIPQATKHTIIITEAMRQLVTYTAEEILQQHELVKEKLRSDNTNVV